MRIGTTFSKFDRRSPPKYGRDIRKFVLGEFFFKGTLTLGGQEYKVVCPALSMLKDNAFILLANLEPKDPAALTTRTDDLLVELGGIFSNFIHWDERVTITLEFADSGKPKDMILAVVRHW